MFDAHAHIGENYQNCLVASSSLEEYPRLKRYEHRAYGLLFPESNCSSEVIKALEADKGALCGEIGLDRRFIKEKDIAFMNDMLSYLKEKQRPFILHLVGRIDEMLSLLKDHRIDFPFMIHGFTSSYEVAHSFSKQGGTISLGPRSLRTRDIKRLVTLPFVLETDMKVSASQQNELLNVYSEVSKLLGIDISTLEEETEKNLSYFLK
ncbi:MAG: TatD family hydrolase [Sphaerochaetaceae bacterium]|nr:TatD family hydrolase [Sphaerochaetaceae bacterium]